MLSVRYIRGGGGGGFKVKNAIALTATIGLGRSMNFKGKDYIIHVPQCLPGMDKRANNFCKQRAECFNHFLVIVLMEHGQRQASFTPEKSTDKPRLV